jgi:hypothetical protein
VLKIHSNPFLPDILDAYQNHFCKPTINSSLLDTFFEMLKEYLAENYEEKPYIFVIRGA